MLLTAQQAWDALKYYKNVYYDSMSAMYSGNVHALALSGKPHTFWKRSNCNCRIHVPLPADIAQTSANMLFSQPPKIMVDSDGEGEADSPQQKRLDVLGDKNFLQSVLSEAAETCAALGDIYLKIRWSQDADIPILEAAQPDASWAEYTLGELSCVHFFTPVKIDYQYNKWTRIYERYEKGVIHMELYLGTDGELGSKQPDSELEQYGYQPEIKTPVDELLAVHIANVRPNRLFRESRHGRSDLDDLRDLCDGLDETYSSWIRDVRLAKARLIVPADYLRSKPQGMIDGIQKAGRWEFDTDVETYVAMDIHPEDGSGGTGIVPSQFAIRSNEHSATCLALVEEIVSRAGYSPQTFGLDINGTAQSGTALNIREKKSVITRNKKRTYWKQPLEKILSALVHVDAALYPAAGSRTDEHVSVEFADSMGIDINSIAQAIQMLANAKAISTEQMISMQHPDWSIEQQQEEIDRCVKQYAIDLEEPLDAMLGDEET